MSAVHSPIYLVMVSLYFCIVRNAGCDAHYIISICILYPSLCPVPYLIQPILWTTELRLHIQTFAAGI